MTIVSFSSLLLFLALLLYDLSALTTKRDRHSETEFIHKILISTIQFIH